MDERACFCPAVIVLWCAGGAGPAGSLAVGSSSSIGTGGGVVGGGGGAAGGGGTVMGDLGPAAGAAVDAWGLLRLSLTAVEPPDQPGQQVRE